MKKEIDAIRAKDIAQGGLTQGQQTQIARNEQRMTQVKTGLFSQVFLSGSIYCSLENISFDFPPHLHAIFSPVNRSWKNWKTWKRR